MEFAATVAADSDERCRPGQRCRMLVPQFDDYSIDDRCPQPDQFGDSLSRKKT